MFRLFVRYISAIFSQFYLANLLKKKVLRRYIYAMTGLAFNSSSTRIIPVYECEWKKVSCLNWLTSGLQQNQCNDRVGMIQPFIYLCFDDLCVKKQILKKCGERQQSNNDNAGTRGKAVFV